MQIIWSSDFALHLEDYWIDQPTSNFWIMSQCDPAFDLKINVCHSDLYFTVKWFFFIFWRLFDGWTSNFWKMTQCDTTFDLKINVGHSDLYFTVQWFLSYILNNDCLMDEHEIFGCRCDATVDLKVPSISLSGEFVWYFEDYSLDECQTFG